MNSNKCLTSDFLKYKKWSYTSKEASNGPPTFLPKSTNVQVLLLLEERKFKTINKNNILKKDI
jgi:hypothetical protein